MTSLFKNVLAAILILSSAAAVYATDTNSNVRTIEIEGMDNMKYDVEEIIAEPGETLRIVFRTVSNMPPQAMQHNIAILDLDTDIDAFVNASIVARDNEYIAPELEDQVVAYTEMIGGGETSTIEFTVPETPGDYIYVCTFPGHYPAGMAGTLVVRGSAS